MIVMIIFMTYCMMICESSINKWGSQITFLSKGVQKINIIGIKTMNKQYKQCKKFANTNFNFKNFNKKLKKTKNLKNGIRKVVWAPTYTSYSHHINFKVAFMLLTLFNKISILYEFIFRANIINIYSKLFLQFARSNSTYFKFSLKYGSNS